VILLAADRSSVLDVARIEPGVRGRFPDRSDEWVYPAAATSGYANEVELLGSVVMNEVDYEQPSQYGKEGVYGDTQATPVSASWRYFQGGSQESGWAEESHPDWEEGTGAFGFGVSADSSPASIQTNLNPGQITYYFETDFDFGAAGSAVE